MAVILAIFLLPLSGQSQQLDTTFVVTTAINAHGSVRIDNANFDVQVKTWERSEIKVEYVLKIGAKEITDLRAFVKSFDASLKKTISDGKGEKVNTVVSFDSFSRNNKKIVVKLNGVKERYELTKLEGTYTLFIPKTCSVDLHSSFQNVTIEPLESDVTIDINSAELSMGSCRNLELTASFCKKMTIGDVESAKLRINSGNVNLGNVATNLYLDADFSKIVLKDVGNEAIIRDNSCEINMGNAQVLKMNSSFGRKTTAGKIASAEFDINSTTFSAEEVKQVSSCHASFSTLSINKVDNYTIQSATGSYFWVRNLKTLRAPDVSFTEFNIDMLWNSFIVDSNSGDIHIKKVQDGFEQISIEGQFVKIGINATRSANYLVKANLDFPKFNYDDLTVVSHNQELNRLKFEGFKGNKDKAKSLIEINCQNCNINL